MLSPHILRPSCVLHGSGDLDWSLLMPRMVLGKYLLAEWGQHLRLVEVRQPAQGHTSWECGKDTG